MGGASRRLTALRDHLRRAARFFAGMLAAVAVLGFVVSLSGSAAILLLMAGTPVLLIVLLVGSIRHNLHGTQLMIGKPPRGSTLAVLAVPTMLVGTLMLAWPGQVPLVLLVPALVWLALGGPASMIGFALARDYNPRHRISTATGMVNIGGFCGAVVGIFLVGQILQGQGKFDEAIAAYKGYLAKYPNGPQSADAQRNSSTACPAQGSAGASFAASSAASRAATGSLRRCAST